MEIQNRSRSSTDQAQKASWSGNGRPSRCSNQFRYARSAEFSMRAAVGLQSVSVICTASPCKRPTTRVAGRVHVWNIEMVRGGDHRLDLRVRLHSPARLMGR